MASRRTLLRALQCLAILAVISFAPVCLGESVFVQVVNGKSGKPVANEPVAVQLTYAATPTEEGYSVTQRYMTDSNGQVEVPLPWFNPESLEVQISLSRGLHCPSRVLAKTATVLHTGLTVAGRSRSKSAPIPGHIVFVARPSNFLEKVLYDS